MNKRPLALLLSLLTVLAAGAGCSSTRTYTYDVTVVNETSQPLTLWLTKNGGPPEAGWKSPERLAIEHPAMDERVPGVVLAPGKTGFTGAVRGEFAPGSSAVLRIYGGQHTLSELLSMGRRHPERVDVPLRPGKNDLTIRQDGAHLSVSEAPQPPAPPP